MLRKSLDILIMCRIFFLMIRRPPRSTRTDTLFPYTTLFRSRRRRAGKIVAALTEGIGSEKIEVADPARSGNPDRSVAEGECGIVVFRSQVHAQRGVAIGICRADSSVGAAGNIEVILAVAQVRPARLGGDVSAFQPEFENEELKS